MPGALVLLVVALYVLGWLAFFGYRLCARRGHPFSVADYLLRGEAYVKWYAAQVERAAQEYQAGLKHWAAEYERETQAAMQQAAQAYEAELKRRAEESRPD